MSLFSENVVPGKPGKVFSSDAKYDDDIKAIKKLLLDHKGIKEVVIDYDKFPKEFTICTDKIVAVDEIENLVKTIGFHLIPVGAF